MGNSKTTKQLEEILKKLQAQAEERMRAVVAHDGTGIIHADITNKIRDMVKLVGILRGDFYEDGLTRKKASEEFLGIVCMALTVKGDYGFILSQPVYEAEVVGKYIADLEAKNAQLNEQKKGTLNSLFAKVVQYAPKDLDEKGKKTWLRGFLGNFNTLKEEKTELKEYEPEYTTIMESYREAAENTQRIEKVKKMVEEGGIFSFQKTYEYSNNPLTTEVDGTGRQGRRIYPSLGNIVTVIEGVHRMYMEHCNPEHLTFRDIREGGSIVETLRRENEALKRENEDLKRENEDLKRDYRTPTHNGVKALAMGGGM